MHSYILHNGFLIMYHEYDTSRVLQRTNGTLAYFHFSSQILSAYYIEARVIAPRHALHGTSVVCATHTLWIYHADLTS